MLKASVCFLAFLVPCLIFAANPKSELDSPKPDPVYLKKTFGELINGKPQCEVELSKDNQLAMLKNMAGMIDKGETTEGKPLTSLHLVMFQRYVASWIKTYKYLELDTNISKQWYIKIYKHFQIMNKWFQEMDNAEIHKKKAEFEKAKKLYNDAVDAFLKDLKKPEKPDRKIVEQLHIQKIKEHRQYQEYIRKLRKEEE